ncbi:glycosyltransferase family 4 protein [Photobacterium frigidiphilum]|uniref:glycosyltransferase family 4 protein n=1 Tax=Photobacterium frigidiphilum TaxID=264736 RepID=UPI003D113E9E
MRVVLIGPRYSCKGALGGIVVLFENLISHNVSKDRIAHIVDSNSMNYANKLIMIMLVFIKLIRYWHLHVSLHGTEQDFKYIGILLLIRKKVGGGSYSLRKFAGNYDECYRNYNVIFKKIVSRVLNESDANFFETLALVNSFKVHNQATYWFPNVRSESNRNSINYNNGDIFKTLYLSQVKKEKGILELIEAVKGNRSVSLTIAGKIIDSVIEPNELPENINYIGEIQPWEVSQVMSHHHLLALPTFYAGEGYPGVIIEAFMVGLPVLTTDWKALPELVGDSGYLVPVKNSKEILKSIEELQKYTHNEYRLKSKERAFVFSDVKATNQFWSVLGK